jgi:hypothetical protein
VRFALRGDVRGGQGLHFGETSPADFRLGLVLRARSPNLSAQFASGRGPATIERNYEYQLLIFNTMIVIIPMCDVIANMK